jgi:hypothetical protein
MAYELCAKGSAWQLGRPIPALNDLVKRPLSPCLIPTKPCPSSRAYTNDGDLPWRRLRME